MELLLSTYCSTLSRLGLWQTSAINFVGVEEGVTALNVYLAATLPQTSTLLVEAADVSRCQFINCYSLQTIGS